MKLKSLLYSRGPGLFRRPDLNHPPTAVGGISEFSHNRYRAVVLMTSWDRGMSDCEQPQRVGLP